MNLKALFILDMHEFREWFQSHTIARLIIVGLYIVTYSFYFFAGFAVSSWVGTFLHNSSSGYELALYSINAGLLFISVVVFWITLLIATRQLLSPSQKHSSLLSIGYNPINLREHFFIRTLTKMSIYGIWFCVPFFMGFAQVFHQQMPLIVLGYFLSITFLAVMATASLGIILSQNVAKLIETKNRTVATTLLILSCILNIYLSVRFAVPGDFLSLVSASTQEFAFVESTLPLNTPIIPGYWLVREFSTLRLDAILIILTLAGMVVSVAFRLFAQHSDLYTQVMPPHTQKRPVQIPKSMAVLTLYTHIFLRQSNAIKMSITIILSLLVVLAALTQLAVHNTLIYLAVILFASLMYGLLIIFPHLSNLKDQSWLLLTGSVGKYALLWQHVIFSLLLGYPLLIVTSGVWLFTPLNPSMQWLGFGLSLWSVSMLILVYSLLGAIAPQFHISLHQKQATSNLVGLIALMIGIFLFGTVALSMLLFIEFTMDPSSLLTITGIITVAMPLLITPIARWSVDRYQL